MSELTTPSAAMERQCAVASRLTDSYSACLTAYDTQLGEASYGYPYAHHQRAYSGGAADADYYRTTATAYRSTGGPSSASSSSYLSSAASADSASAAAARRSYYTGGVGVGSSNSSISRGASSQVTSDQYANGPLLQ